MKHSRYALAALACVLPLSYVQSPARAQQADSKAATTASADPHANETKSQRDARMAWWRKARFGMFIHWGLYSVPAGVYDGKPIGSLGEWIMRTANIPVATYAAYANQFDPEQFNADQWVSYAKAAGMKYIVMTAKHHEGFAMFPSAVDNYNIDAATKFKRDPIGEMAAACRKAGIRFGVYYSQNLDWHHPGGGTAGASWDPAQKGDFDAYVRTVAAPQVRELITRYHPAVLWWDIPGPFNADQVRALTASFPEDPGLIFNNRLGGGIPGDTETPEQYVPATGFPGRDWETCMTINDTWGFKTGDTNFKSSTELLHNLIDIASKGGNYLLNVGPTSQGIIPGPEVERLKEMGAWMKVNGASIYGTSASPYRRLTFEGRATVKGDTLYLHVFHWPDAGLTVTGLTTLVKSATALATHQRLTVSKSSLGTLTIEKPRALDDVDTVVALRLSGPPIVTEAEYSEKPKEFGNYALSAATAALEGDTIKVEGGDNGNIGFWMNSHDATHWKVSVPARSAGRYTASVLFSCEAGSEGSTVELQVDGTDSGVRWNVPSTGAWSDYKTVSLEGTVNLTEGVHTIRLACLSKPALAVMNLRTLTLSPSAR